MKILMMSEVSEQTRVPIDTLRYWRHIGKGPKSFRNGKRVMYLQEEVDGWIESLQAAEIQAAEK